MKTINTLFFLTFFMIAAPAIDAQNWELVWQDEFNNGISPDWIFETGRGSGGWGNNELQYYRRENATVENGQLIITAKKEYFGGANYTSARMKTQGRKSFKYGKIEARIAAPTGQGLWPAFWMLGNNISSVGWPACGEIDILEHVNNSPNIHGTIHWQDASGSYAHYGGQTAVNINNYHLYTVEWNENNIKWFVDGNQYHEVDITNGVNGTSEFHNEYFLLLNMAVGGNWPGFNVDDNRIPARMAVDYVRVYEYNANGGGTPDQVIEAENHTSMSGVENENCSEGGQNVGYIDTGDWMAYANINFPTSGNYRIEYRVASLVGGGVLSADINAGTTVLGQVNIPNTGGWQNWTTVSHTVNVNAGTHDFGMFATSGGWNINWIKITRVSSLKSVKTILAKDTKISKKVSETKLYPNPFKNSLQFNFEEKNAKITVLNTLGQIMLSSKTVESGKPVDLSNLSKGLYLISIEKNGITETVRVIKK